MDPADLLSNRARSSTSSVIRDLLHLVDRPDMLSLAGGLPAPELLPTERVADAAARLLADPVAGRRALQYGPTEGMAELREVVAARLGVVPGSLVITTGSQQGVDLVARALVDPGDVVVVESPSYLGSLQSFRANGASLVAIDGDGDGLRVDLLAAAIEDGLRPKVVSVVTNFANPTGATLSLDRRSALAELADRWGFLVIEDDPYGELRWRGVHLPPISSFTDRAASLGSASKVLSPGLRLGWLRGPAWLLDAVVRMKQSADLHTSSLDQLLAADVLGDGPFVTAHVDRIRAVYAHRSGVLTDALAATFGDRLDVRTPDGGMFVWARWRDGRDATDLFGAAVAAGVAFVPGSAFAVDAAAQGDATAASMRMCFTTLDDDDLRAAVGRLAVAAGG
ncbi:MAG: PLP-dependent aminotransferase family protein [Acidimicrobiales bacterium]